MWRLCRSNNCTPSFCSRLFTDLLNQGCETCKRFWAALVKCSSSPTATKLFSLSRSTFIDISLSDRAIQAFGHQGSCLTSCTNLDASPDHDGDSFSAIIHAR